MNKTISTLLYITLITTILMLMDTLYSLNNDYFIFEFTLKEFFNKLMILILFISFIPKRTIRVVIYLFLLSFSFSQYLHFEYFGKNIDAIEFYLFVTNIHETFETLGEMMGMIVVPFVISAIAFLSIYLIDRKIGEETFKIKYSWATVFIPLLFISSKTFYLTNVKGGKLEHTDSKGLYPTTNRHSSRNFYVSLNYFVFGILPKKIMHNMEEFPTLKKPTLVKKDVNRTVIFIMGESLRYDTFALDNNKLTPKLQTLKDDKTLFFKKVYSGGTMTKVSIATLINRLKYPSGLKQITQENNCLFKLAKENGFKSYIFSAQSDFHMQMLRNMMCPKYIDTFITRDAFSDYFEPTGYDEDLQSLVSKRVKFDEPTFLVLHHRGSHSPYHKQYPKAFDKYTPYENTALYTDNNLYNNIEYFKKHIKGEFFLFYVSDHGELLGENGKQGHGHLAKEVYEVPFLMYTNSKDERLKEPFTYIKNHYDIANYIISLLGYEADLIKYEDRTIYILNSDLDGFSGYGVIDINNSIESKMQKKRY